MKIQENVSLKSYTTFKIGGPAKYFIAAESSRDILGAIKWAKKNCLPFFILGGGSKLLVSDGGFNGLVIKINNQKLKIRGSRVVAGAGLALSQLIAATVKAGLSGLEWASGIPGATLGGAIRGNAGAFKTETKDLVKKVEIVDAKTGRIKIFGNKACRFGYRESIFKENHDLVILSAELALKKTSREKAAEKVKEILSYRQGRHPKFPSAGSIFKNLENMRARDLIEKAGLAGKKIGRAQISPQHANFIVNLGGAKAKDVFGLINLIKKSVKNKFGIDLEEEVEYL